MVVFGGISRLCVVVVVLLRDLSDSLEQIMPKEWSSHSSGLHPMMAHLVLTRLVQRSRASQPTTTFTCVTFLVMERQATFLTRTAKERVT